MKTPTKTLLIGALGALGITLIYLRAWGNKLAGS